MIQLNRRSFLKGMLVAAGTVGLSYMPNTDRFLDQIEQAPIPPLLENKPRPVGAFGSVSFNGDWYPLNGAVIQRPLRHDDGWTLASGERLLSRPTDFFVPHRMTFYIPTDPYEVFRAQYDSAINIEVQIGSALFTTSGWVHSYGVDPYLHYSPDAVPVEYTLEMETDRPMSVSY